MILSEISLLFNPCYARVRYPQGQKKAILQMIYSRLLLSASVATVSAAAGLNYPNIYARQDAAEDVTVSTLTPETVETSTTEGATTEVTIMGETSTWTFGTGADSTTTTSIASSTLDTTLGDSTFSSYFGSTSTVFTVLKGSDSVVTLPSISTTPTLPTIDTTVSISSLSTVVKLDDVVTSVSIAETSTVVVFEGVTTTITIPGTSSDVTISGPSTDVIIASVTTSVSIDGTSAVVDIGTASTSVTVDAGGGGDSSVVTLSYTASSSVSLTYTSTAKISLTRPGTIVTLTLSSTEVTLAVSQTVATVTGTGSTTEITIPAVLTTITLSETSNSSTTSESETTAEVTGPSDSDTTSEETSTEDTTALESTDTAETTTDTPSSFAPTPTLPPGTNPTYCEAVRGPLTPEEEVQLAVLFGDSSGGTTFADYVVSYASQLVAQIADVANIAAGDNDYAFTTAFDSIDIPGVLGLASAAPIYTCFLSTLWAQALSNPQQYAKRAIPSQDEKIKLIVLFEKRATDGMQFDYAELLVDDTNNLIAEVQSVAGAAGAAAAGGDLGAYASLFANVDVAQFLSIATEAPVYTEGLSSAFVTALESYSQSVNRPTSVVMTTHTYTTVSTIVTNVVSGAVTVPTTIFSTVVVTSVGPATSGRETYTSHTTETRIGVTSETVSEVVRETTLPNGEVTMVTERVTVGAPGAASPTAAVPAPGERVTVEIVTGANGRVETRTVTVREETRASAAAQTTRRPEAAQDTRRPNVAYYTEVRGGTTYVHTVEIQTKNAAFKRVAALGTGLLGVLAILL